MELNMKATEKRVRERRTKGSALSWWQILLVLAVIAGLLLSRLGAQTQETQISGLSTDGFESRTFLEAMDRIFDTSSDSVNFEEGILNWKGQSFSFGDSRAMRSRFVQYLNSPVNTMDNRVYLALLDDISHRLSVLEQQENFDRADPWRNVVSAWKLLHQAAEYSIDGRNSLVIANMVHGNWRDRQEFRDQAFWRDLERAEMDRSRQIAVSETDRDFRREMDRARSLERLRREGAEMRLEGASAQGREAPEDEEERTPVEARMGLDYRAMDRLTSLDVAMEELIRSQAMLEGRELRMREIGALARLKMQSQVVSFMMQRRFHHALILSSFYRMLFRGSAQELEVGRSQLSGLLPEMEFIPTVDMLEFLSLQALDDVRRAMDSVNNAYEQGQKVAALERLQEAFFLGEYSLPVIGFPEDRKRTLRDLYFKLRDARRLADLRDYEAVERLVVEIESMTDDFSGDEVRAMTRVAKQASQVKLLGARSAALRNNFEQAERLIGEAFEIWPLNPAIENFMSDAVSGADYVREFDIDYESGDYRRIFHRRAEYLTALVGDAERSERLGKVLETIQRIEFAVQTAQHQLDQGNAYLAWEVLQEIAGEADDDPEYHRAVARVAPRVADWVGILEEAARSERSGHNAAAINHYLRARAIYPPSRLVNQALERLGAALLDEVAREQVPTD